MRLLRALVVLAFLAVAAPAWAAWSFIGCTDGGNVHSMSRSVTAGNLLTTLYINGASGDVPSAADGVNTWTKVGTTLPDTNFNNSTSWWWASAATTASITVTISSITGADEGMAICEWHSSVANVPSNSFETQNANHQNPGVSGADNTTSGLVSAPGSSGDIFLCWSVNVQTGTNVETAGTGFTDRFTGTGGNVLRLEEFIQGAAAAKTGTWTNSGTNDTNTHAAFFKEAGGATLVPQRSLTGAGT